MKRFHVLRLYVMTGTQIDKVGGKIDQLQALFGDGPEYEDARQVAESLKVAILEVGKGLDFMERRFRGESHDEAYNHAYTQQPDPVGSPERTPDDPDEVEH